MLQSLVPEGNSTNTQSNNWKRTWCAFDISRLFLNQVSHRERGWNPFETVNLIGRRRKALLPISFIINQTIRPHVRFSNLQVTQTCHLIICESGRKPICMLAHQKREERLQWYTLGQCNGWIPTISYQCIIYQFHGLTDASQNWILSWVLQFAVFFSSIKRTVVNRHVTKFHTKMRIKELWKEGEFEAY